MVTMPEEKLKELFMAKRLVVKMYQNGRCIAWQVIVESMPKLKVFDGSTREFNRIVKGN